MVACCFDMSEGLEFLAAYKFPVLGHYEGIQEKWREKYPDLWLRPQRLGSSAINLQKWTPLSGVVKIPDMV